MSLQKIFLHDLLEYFNCKANKSEYVIIGENPFISLCLLKKIAEHSCLEQRKISVSIIKLSNTDYWGYHAFEQDEIWFKISDLLNTKINNIEQFMDACISIYNNKNVELNFFDISAKIKHIKYDDMSKNWVLFLNDMNSNENTDACMKKLPTVLLLEKNLKEKYWNTLMDRLNIDINIVTKDQGKMVLFAENILLSSYPQNWLNVEIIKGQKSSDFKHILSDHSFGTSRRMTNEFLILEDHVIEDLNLALNANIN
jgi:hypothetical protein